MYFNRKLTNQLYPKLGTKPIKLFCVSYADICVTIVKMSRTYTNKGKKCYRVESCGLYHKDMTIVNDASSWSITLELSIMLPESSIMLLQNNYSTGIAHGDRQ
jgi:hypothetical protein